MTRNAHRMDATLALRSNISIYGGYSPDFTARGGRTVLEVESDIAVQAAGLTGPVTLQSITITNGDGDDMGSDARFALWVENSGAHLRLEGVELSAGRGSSGADGASGRDGDSGRTGNDARGTQGGRGVGQGGNGAAGREEEPGLAGRQGRFGGGQCAGNPSGRAGVAGNNRDPNGDCCEGGNSALTSQANVEAGGDGQTGVLAWLGGTEAGVWVLDNLKTICGCRVSVVTAPAVVSAVAVAVEEARRRKLLLCRRGRRPMRDGGADFLICLASLIFADQCYQGHFGTGRGGGGGGDGGSGGQSGLGGEGGHPSIGLVIQNSNVTMVKCTVRTAGGGSGGAGGNGGLGGDGGDGGRGAVGDNSTGGNGGDGGDGGVGGIGGCGGGGGGGPSIGIWNRQGGQFSYDPVIPDSANTYEIGPGGAGGAACERPGREPANAGQNGLRAEVHQEQ